MNSTPTRLALADFDGDGDIDIVAANSGGTISYLGNVGHGTFNPAVNYTSQSGSVDIVADDFNNDGRMDVATANQNANSISVFISTGDGTFNSAANHTAINGAIAIASGDFNNDGTKDLLVGGNANTVSYFLPTPVMPTS